MERIHVNTGAPYDVIIEEGLLSHLSDYILPLKDSCQAIIVSDSHVAPLYLAQVKGQLEAAGFSVLDFIFPAGESSKNASTLLELVEYMAHAKMTRGDLLIALGGGVVGDMGGFAAATYLRGIDYIQIPTSLLAAVDSSVGGKTAVNLSAGKNLWGAFKQPITVLCDPQTLKTLPRDQWINGCGEIIKYGFLDVPGLLDLLEAKPLVDNPDQATAVIARCVHAKASIVQADEKEGSIRALLNLGHTLAHGIEKESHFTVAHGNAVAIGLMLMAQGAVRNDSLDSAVLPKLKALLESHYLPTSTNIPKDRLLEAAQHDKKSHGASITIVVPKTYGHSELKEVTFEQLATYLD